MLLRSVKCPHQESENDQGDDGELNLKIWNKQHPGDFGQPIIAHNLETSTPSATWSPFYKLGRGHCSAYTAFRSTPPGFSDFGGAVFMTRNTVCSTKKTDVG